MSTNCIRIAFVFNALALGLCALLINFFERYLPASLPKLIRHGKFCANVKHAYLDKYEVPKRWFKHFYVFSGLLCSVTLALLYYRYCLNNKLPDVAIWALDFLLGRPRQSLVPVENVMLAMIIFTIHLWKRYYESHFVSVYSDVRMSVGIYVLAFLHYFGSVISIVGESYGITKDMRIDLDWTRLSLLDYTCSLIFLVSTYLQFRANIILANLRKDKKGAVATKKYKVPQGELFNYVSGPLQLTEIIIYLCLSVILRSASTFHFVTLWVIVNQVECAYLSHEWSLRKLENYPKSRKIIVPFIF